MQSPGVVIKGYHTYNGTFNDSYFMEDLLENHKNIRCSGSGASHQNGAPDCATKTVITMASTTLMHSAPRCTQYKLSTDIWPM